LRVREYDGKTISDDNRRRPAIGKQWWEKGARWANNIRKGGWQSADKNRRKKPAIGGQESEKKPAIGGSNQKQAACRYNKTAKIIPKIEKLQ
jgi:hypothetical protein